MIELLTYLANLEPDAVRFAYLPLINLLSFLTGIPVYEDGTLV